MAKSIGKKIRLRILIILVTFISIIFVSSILMIYTLCRKYSSDIAVTASYFAEAIINPDRAKDYLTTRNKDSRYNETLSKMNNYSANEKWLNRMSLISFSNTNGYYIYDTGGEKLGTKLQYDDYTESVKAELINGRKRWERSKGNTYYVYAPVRTSDDKLAGYIVIETDNSFYIQYIFIISAVFSGLLLILFIFSLTLSRFMNREIFTPIKLLSKRALDYTGSVMTSDDLNTELFLIDKDDEIGDLSKAIRKMMDDINNSTVNLSKSIFEATHDGMTQVFNKRHYNNMVDNFHGCSSICVIYFDVNNLKLMNDTLGHEKGDMVIKAAADYINNFTGESSFCFRMGGDEFLMVMTECTFKDIDRIIEKLENDSPVILNGDEDSVKCALSYGYAYAKGFYSYEQLLSEAEENMYRKKSELKKLLDMPDR